MKIKFFNIAKRLSTLSSHHSHFIGSVITRKNKIISVGYNQLKTHPKSPHSHKYIHAEIKAILSANYRDLPGCSIYVYRETKNGTKACSKPCNHCLKLIKTVGIKVLHYTDEGTYKTEIL